MEIKFFSDGDLERMLKLAGLDLRLASHLTFKQY